MRDFHTHFAGARGYPFLFSGECAGAAELVSYQQHPWYLPERFEFDAGDFAGKLRSFAALGEVGLDKLRGPAPAVQEQFLDAMLAVAVQLDKPVLFHNVKCTDRLLAKVKFYHLKKVVFHGFRGKPELLAMLWRAGVTVSFHPGVCRNDALLAMLKHPAGRFGFESDDDAGCDLPQVVEIAMLGSGNRDLEKLADAAFEEFLYG